MNAMETALFEAHIAAFKAATMLKDALVIILPYLPETAPEAEQLKSAIAETKSFCDLIHETLCRSEARHDKNLIPFRRNN